MAGRTRQLNGNVNLQLLTVCKPLDSARTVIPRGPRPDRITRGPRAGGHRAYGCHQRERLARPRLSAEYARSKIILNTLPLGPGKNHN
jgi:hypothetical protein